VKTISLTQCQVAVVDDSDYEWLSRWKWYARFDPAMDSFYAVRNGSKENGKRSPVLMHREILGLKKGDPREGDHIESGSTLDNRRSNLRISVHAQNAKNRRINRRNKTGFKGVHFDTESGRWKAQIHSGKQISLGRFETPEKAYEAYCKAAKKYYGDFARLA